MPNKQHLYAKELNGELVFDNQNLLADFLAKNSNKTFKVTIERETGMRTMNQNSALHLYFSLVAEALNAGGYTVQAVLKESLDIDWNKDLVKENIWRPVQEITLGKKSTIDLAKVSDIDEVYEHVNRFLAEHFFIHIPFPSDNHL